MKKRARTTLSLQFSSTLEKSGNRLWGCHVEVPDHIAAQLTDGGSRRVVCSLNGSEEFQRALIPNGNGSYVITVNKALRDSLHLTICMQLDVTLRKDESMYGLPMPAELEELLQQDKEGHRLFHSLTPGKRRNLLYIVGAAKSQHLRASRAVTVVTHLKLNGGRVNFRQLYESLRQR
ncbi:MAG: YdeI/OmpD-associated family protein [Ignavibacteria bacterium]|nr:YdeI/OmpD-associated family protein [Ignavibacteria bacterium]